MRACYVGFITQAIINNLAPILFIIFQTEFQISFEMIGRLIFLNFGTQILADIFAVRYADTIGHRKMAVMAHGFAALGLVGLGLFPQIFPSPYVGLGAAVMIYAVGGGIIEVLVSPMVEALPTEAKASAMSLLHSFYCWGQMGVVILTTLVLWAFGTDIWVVLPIAWAVVPIYNLFKFLKVPLMPALAMEHKLRVRELLRSNAFVLAMVLMIASGASELTMSQWSSLFAERGLQVPKVVGDLLGPALFALLMGIGRTVFGIWGHRMDLKKMLLGSGILCVVCYGITVFAQNPMVALIGAAVCGLSVALMWPGTMSLSAAAYPMGGTAMFGLLAIGGDIGAAAGPWAAGYVSDVVQRSPELISWAIGWELAPDQLGLKAGLLVATVFPVLLVGALLLMKRNGRRASESRAAAV